jgi:hypothetical protein
VDRKLGRIFKVAGEKPGTVFKVGGHWTGKPGKIR